MKVRFAYQANCWGPLGGAAVGVTSIGQLFYQTFGDMSRAIAEIAAAGYQGVEMFDGNVVENPGGLGALKTALVGAGVELVAVYSGANFIFPDVLDQEARPDRACGRCGGSSFSRTSGRRRRRQALGGRRERRL